MEKNITFLGRTMEKEGMTYFNWTCSGFQFAFEADKVEAQLYARYTEENGERLTPFIAVFLDDMETPYKIIELKEGAHWYVLYEGEKERHRLRVLKRTEAQHAKNALMQVRAEGGNIFPCPCEERLRLEFIGDSITCGYGNESNCPEDGFRPVQENGWEAYAAKTARKLHAQFRMISVSGIGVYSSYTDVEKRNADVLMKDVYGCTDYFMEREAEWNFENYQPDIIVICLGTNDFSYVQYNFEKYAPEFQKSYYELLQLVRKKNGAKPYILCCFGIMGEGLNHAIEETVQKFIEENGEQRMGILPLKEQRIEDGRGGSFHPTIVTHEKMSDEVCKALKYWGSQEL